MEGGSNISKTLFWVSLFSVFIVAITLSLGLLLDGAQNPEWLLIIVQEHFSSLIGIPLAIISAIFIVSLFKYQTNDIEVEFIGFKFKGAAGPLVMWILVFLSVVHSINLLW